MINRPDFTHPLERIHSIQRDHHDEEEQENEKKQKVRYFGRSWKEEEDRDFPVQPTPAEIKSKPHRETLVASRQILEKAEKWFTQMTTLEEKAAQLVFCLTEAVYDIAYQHQLEILIQAWQIGGVLFMQGEYKRQCYLIERYQELTKTPLMIGNDLVHGLSSYFQGTLPELTEHFSDLGKTVAVQNRKAGIHFQCISLRATQTALFAINEKKRLYFRNGIKEAHGIAAQEAYEKEETLNLFHPQNPCLRPSTPPQMAFNERHVQEVLGNKILFFNDLTTKETQEGLKEAILGGFKKQSDVFLLTQSQAAEAIQMIYDAVRSGKISERELDKRVKKLLVLKASVSER